jgi:tripartite-type tricarboxylate transporter receptor subunit TctC
MNVPVAFAARHLVVCGLVAAGIVTAGTSLPTAAAAQSAYPTRPISLVIPFPPGGATDVLGRVIGHKMAMELGQPVVVENRSGAGTIIGAGYVAKAKPDGYTLLVSSGTTFTVNPAIRSNLPYDPIKDFEPIGISGRTGLILLANSAVPVNTVKQFVDYVKAAPDKHAYGSYGSGTTAHFAGESILSAAGLKMTHVPYKGSAPAMTDLMGGQIPFSIDTVAAAIPQLKTGKIKAIAVTAAKRSALLPDVPTMAESGYPEIDMDTWLIIAAPRGLPADVKARLEKALVAVMADPETREKLIGAGFEPSYSNAAEASQLIERELPVMRAVAKQANITAE